MHFEFFCLSFLDFTFTHVVCNVSSTESLQPAKEIFAGDNFPCSMVEAQKSLEKRTSHTNLQAK